MDKNEFNFSSDCVINFDDLGEFKDFTDIVAQVQQKLTKLKLQKKWSLPNQIWEIITADPDDTFHVPKFQNLIRLLLQNEYIIENCTQANFNHLVALYFQILEEYLLSYTFKEEIGEMIIKRFQQWKLSLQSVFFQGKLLKFLYRMGEKIIFIENIEKLLDLYQMFDEKLFFGDLIYKSQQSPLYMAMHVQVCEKFLRNKQIRKQIKQNIAHYQGVYLKMKLMVWINQKQRFYTLKSQIQKVNYFSNEYLKETIQTISLKFQEI